MLVCVCAQGEVPSGETDKTSDCVGGDFVSVCLSPFRFRLRRSCALGSGAFRRDSAELPLRGRCVRARVRGAEEERDGLGVDLPRRWASEPSKSAPVSPDREFRVVLCVPTPGQDDDCAYPFLGAGLDGRDDPSGLFLSSVALRLALWHTYSPFLNFATLEALF